MRRSIYLTVAAACLLLLIATACGSGKRTHGSLTGVAVSNSQAAHAEVGRPQAEALTDEDVRVLAMSYKDRLEYLQQKYRDLVFELHGIVIEESVAIPKGTSDKDNANHRVEENNPEPEDPLRWNEEIQDYMELSLVGPDRRWSLSFLERIQGDYDFNGAVVISDITPVAVNYTHEWKDNDPQHPGNEWPENWDPHLRRVSNGNGKIGIDEVTPIAVNFGLVLEGYNVYYAPAGTNDWTEEPVLTLDYDTYREEAGEEYPYYANYRAE